MLWLISSMPVVAAIAALLPPTHWYTPDGGAAAFHLVILLGHGTVYRDGAWHCGTNILCGGIQPLDQYLVRFHHEFAAGVPLAHTLVPYPSPSIQMLTGSPLKFPGNCWVSPTFGVSDTPAGHRLRMFAPAVRRDQRGWLLWQRLTTTPRSLPSVAVGACAAAVVVAVTAEAVTVEAGAAGAGVGARESLLSEQAESVTAVQATTNKGANIHCDTLLFGHGPLT